MQYILNREMGVKIDIDYKWYIDKLSEYQECGGGAARPGGSPANRGDQDGGDPAVTARAPTTAHPTAALSAA